jgi:hypothetical protein
MNIANVSTRHRESGGARSHRPLDSRSPRLWEDLPDRQGPAPPAPAPAGQPWLPVAAAPASSASASAAAAAAASAPGARRDCVPAAPAAAAGDAGLAPGLRRSLSESLVARSAAAAAAAGGGGGHAGGRGRRPRCAPASRCGRPCHCQSGKGWKEAEQAAAWNQRKRERRGAEDRIFQHELLRSAARVSRHSLLQ